MNWYNLLVVRNLQSSVCYEHRIAVNIRQHILRFVSGKLKLLTCEAAAHMQVCLVPVGLYAWLFFEGSRNKSAAELWEDMVIINHFMCCLEEIVFSGKEVLPDVIEIVPFKEFEVSQPGPKPVMLSNSHYEPRRELSKTSGKLGYSMSLWLSSYAGR
jgi:hypothetical protein